MAAPVAESGSRKPRKIRQPDSEHDPERRKQSCPNTMRWRPNRRSPESDGDDEQGRIAAQESLARGVCPAADKRPQALRAPSIALGAFPLAASDSKVVDRRRYAGFRLERIAKSASRIDADVTLLVRRVLDHILRENHAVDRMAILILATGPRIPRMASTTNPLSTIFTAGPRWSIETRDLSGRRGRWLEWAIHN